jgi:hypothetical protein
LGVAQSYRDKVVGVFVRFSLRPSSKEGIMVLSAIFVQFVDFRFQYCFLELNLKTSSAIGKPILGKTKENRSYKIDL